MPKVISKQDVISSGNPSSGSFQIDKTVGVNTIILLQTPVSAGVFTATITDPASNQLTLIDSTNWLDAQSSITVASLNISDLAVRVTFFLSIQCRS